MGSALGRLLRKAGLRVVTTCHGRSATTESQARSSCIEILPSVEDVVAQSHFVFSLVLPTAAVEVAQQYVACRKKRPLKSVFVEANSIGLETLSEIECLMARYNIPLVDAAIHGGAHHLEDIGTLYLSGPHAKGVEQLVQGMLRVDGLGKQLGSASSLKLIMAGISKMLAAMFLDMGSLAERTGLWNHFWENCHQFYPGTMTTIERLLPTYPRHAARRVGEMREIEHLAHASDLPSGLAHEAGEVIRRVACVDWDQVEAESRVDIATIIRIVAKTYSSQSAAHLVEAKK